MASRSHRGRRAAVTAISGGGRPAALLASRAGRAATAHPHRAAAGLFALLVLVYLWPALVGGGLLSPTALLYTQPPFQAAARRGVEHWINGDLGDVPFAYYPWDALARRLIRAGTFPAWNPYAFAGTPLFANSQIGWLSPFSLPLWLLPLNYGLGVAAALKLWFAGFGTYLLARELRLGFWPAMTAGTAFALCSFNIVWLSYGVFVSVAALLPWALWLVERIVQRGEPAYGLALAGVVACALAGGHPGTEVHALAATVLYGLVRVATIRDADRRDRLARFALVAGGIAVGALVTAVVLLPAQQAAVGTVGAAARANGSPGFGGSRMPAGVLRTALFPDWWGRPSEGVVAGPVFVGYRERTFYAGVATLLLAAVALATRGGWRRKAPFALLGALGLAIALRLPGMYQLAIHAPGFDRVQNSRVYLWFLLAIAVLAGFGLEQVLQRGAQLGRVWLVPVAGLLAAVVAVVAISPHPDAWSLALSRFVRRSRSADLGALALASVLWWLLFAVAFAALLLLVRRRPALRNLAAAAVTLLVALDLLHFAHGFQPIGPVSAVVPPPTPAITYLERHRDAGRIAGIEAMNADWGTLYGLRDVRGSDAPLPTERFFRLWRLMDPVADPYSLAHFTALSPRVLGLLGARYLLLPPGVQVAGAVSAVYQGPDATVYENRLVAPRAFVASAVRPVSGGDDELAAIGEAGFDPRRDATVRTDEATGPMPTGSHGTARVVAEANASVVLHATLAQRGLVVLDDTWAPGWSVEVDGTAARTIPASSVLRGVVVTAGHHQIVWRYRVPGLRLGMALSMVGLLAAAVWGSALVARSRRARRR
ncbi:MAG: hypothetical protein JSS99_00645 [Actinobacteria bacterium]|nr:hypothetical protein [Actinomycetota bacterium]